MAKHLNDRQLTTKTAPGRYLAAKNLYLVIGKRAGARSWVFMYVSPVTGKRREYGLGSTESVTLAKARTEADKLRVQIAEGRDPVEQKKEQKRQAKADATTFGDYAEDWIKAREGKWRSSRGASMRGALKNHAENLTKMAIAKIESKDVIDVLKPVFKSAPVVAGLLQTTIERVLDAARVDGLREGENPARWRNHLSLRFERRTNYEHHEAMPYNDIPEWFAACNYDPLKLLVLTALRSAEIRGAQWDEFDLDAKVWTIPAKRMKANRDHRIPLTDAAIEILNRQPRKPDDPFVFGGGRIASSTFMRQVGVTGVTVHGFRSSFRDWAFEETDHSREVIEVALAHVVGDQTERAYRRGDALEKRRALMSDWANYVTSKKA
jgi:integrase